MGESNDILVDSGSFKFKSKILGRISANNGEDVDVIPSLK